jgi:alpha-N-acetylglucosaminidase
VRPVSDAYRTARRVHDVLATAPYQGLVTVAAEPPAPAPGGSARLTAAFRNTCGLSPAGRVDFALTGVEAEPLGPLSLPHVTPGGAGTAAWRVTAPGGPVDRPLTPLPFEVTAEYGQAGGTRVRTVHPGTLFVAGPPAEGWRTVTTNAAVFGWTGERIGIDGAGADLWKATAEFGAVYREGALTAGASVTVRVDAQAATGAWARAGIAVRNRLSEPQTGAGSSGRRGFVNLAVTPANGVVLSYDADGDGVLDTRQRVTGPRAPVLLRLSRAAGTGADAATYSGEFSANGGASWRTVATVRVPGASARQDAGVFMSAGNGGNGARGTVEFSGWTAG